MKFRTHVEPPEPMKGLEVPPTASAPAPAALLVEPEDFARALDADPAARDAYDRLPQGRKRQHVLAIDSAKKPETRLRRIENALAELRDGAGR
ncbi:YdeI/OmpD-associated family protein [Streptomyces sp. DG2A-72]|uniref:YdeI/OmpD-associated family protein n=1 Tax=Streptomyces sp. DG2A-72 TaxID=3051386 RepID=UPI00265B9BF8|nr:YdeI/OmpD-associated family protein [Streptomyces sp. DG2A-72]MDO0937246.1 YdeI/OmpD-associated family protein [Streptomyces sp. DG2A-72]